MSSGTGAEDPDAPSTGEGAAAYLANVFTAKGNETLEAASFYTTDEGTSYAIDVYLNPAEGDPASGTKVGGTQTGSEAYPGYHTVELDTDLRASLQKGDTFSLVVRLENPLYKNVVPAEAVIGRGAEFQPVYVGKDADGNEVPMVNNPAHVFSLPLGVEVPVNAALRSRTKKPTLKAE